MKKKDLAENQSWQMKSKIQGDFRFDIVNMVLLGLSLIHIFLSLSPSAPRALPRPIRRAAPHGRRNREASPPCAAGETAPGVSGQGRASQNQSSSPERKSEGVSPYHFLKTLLK